MLQPGPLTPNQIKTKPALLSNGAYNFLKPIVTLVLPAFGSLYFALAQIWGFSSAEEVVGTIAAVNVLLGVLLQVSSFTYNGETTTYDGRAVVESDSDGVKQYSLELNSDPASLKNNQVITFKVVHK